MTPIPHTAALAAARTLVVVTEATRTRRLYTEVGGADLRQLICNERTALEATNVCLQ